MSVPAVPVADVDVGPPARRTVGEQAADYVRSLIVGGELRPGARVPQAAIAAAFGISRTPLREALVILEREGWLSIEVHRGAFVNALDARSIADHYRLYGLLLGLAATLAIERAAGNLADTLDRARRAFAATSDPVARTRSALDFNRAILDAAASPRLRQLLKLMRGFPLEDYFTLVPDAGDRQEHMFRSVAAAVRAGDGGAASAAYAALMGDAAASVIRALTVRGVIPRSPAVSTAGRDRP